VGRRGRPARGAGGAQVFAKADPRVAQFYETGLVPKALWGFGGELRKKFQATKTVLLKARRARFAHQGLVRKVLYASCPGTVAPRRL